MANKFFLLLLFFTLQCELPPLFADNLVFDETQNPSATQCDAPAPDSFQVTIRASNFITVAWSPVWNGASYTLAVFTRTDSASSWMLVDSFHSVTGSTLTVNNVPFEDECTMIIATNCTNEEPSIHFRQLWDKIIIDLATGGRIPISPVPIACVNLPTPTPTYNWVGFQVAKATDFSPQNTFEVMVTYPSPWVTKVSINRVHENNVVFASDNNNNIPPPTIQTSPIFKMIRRSQNQDHTIGKLEVTKIGASINLCKSNSFPWDNSYTFTPIKANTIYGFTPPPLTESLEMHKGSLLFNKVDKISAQSPFYETLNVFIESKSQTMDNIAIRLISTSGKTVFAQQFQTPFEQISIPVDGIKSGIYMLRLETDKEIHTMKVVKGL